MDGDVVLVDLEINDTDNMIVPRTLVFETSSPPPEPFEFSISNMDVNSDGDLELFFAGQQGRYLYNVRVGLLAEGKKNSKSIIDVIDYSAILGENEPMIIHGAWIRNAMEELNFNISSFDIAINEGQALDVDNGYQLVGILSGAVIGESASALSPSGRRLITVRPEHEEAGTVTQEMLQGRRPDIENPSPRLGRNLASLHRKILVHGYCESTGHWPLATWTVQQQG